MIDVDLFKQALLNLVLNADHAMPSGGDLILTTRREGAWIVIDVIDTGVGMTDEVRSRIFDAFFSTRAAGSGLGLPTTRKIVEAHGGMILVRSDPGKGSQFTIRLPVCEARTPVHHSPYPESSPTTASFPQTERVYEKAVRPPKRPGRFGGPRLDKSRLGIPSASTRRAGKLAYREAMIRLGRPLQGPSRYDDESYLGKSAK